MSFFACFKSLWYNKSSGGFIMIIATWNIGSGINTNDYVGEFFDKVPEANPDDKCMQIIAKQIIENNIDVISLQEVITTESFEYIEKLSKLTGLEYYETFENSPSHLIKNTMYGIAILSKYPIEMIKKEFFKNPDLTKTTAKGVYKSHDKGYMIAKIHAPEPFCISNTHFLPFHRFDTEILEYAESFVPFQNDLMSFDAIACGDYNVVEGSSKLKILLNNLTDFEFVFDEVSTVDNKKCDNILIPKKIAKKSKKMIKNTDSSDHFMCIVEI